MRPDPRYELAWVPQVPHPLIAQRDPSMVASSVDACASNRSLDGAARLIDSADRLIARNVHCAAFSQMHVIW